jgi:hypothetical protein
MGKTPSQKLIKGQIRSWFRTDCGKCYRCFDCMFARGPTMERTDYLLAARGYRQPVTQAMIKGRETHDEYLSQFKTVDEYGIWNLKNDLMDGKEITLSEVRVCSRLYGLRGVLDLLKIRYKDGVLDAKIVEFKNIMIKKYFTQLAAYGTILTDRRFEVVYHHTRKNSDKLYVTGLPLLPDGPFKMNLSVQLQTWTGKKFEREWLVENKMTKWAEGIHLGLLKKVKDFRSLHKYDIYLIPNKDRSKQMFLGKKKILVGHKPKVKR